VTPAARRAAIAGALLAGTFALYAGVRSHDFVNLDDRIFILDNPTLRLGWTLAGIWQALTTRLEAYWIPVTALSLQASAALHGFAPAGYLLTNVALHAANAVLLFLAFDRMTGATARSALVAAVFAVHPLHVESVAWASERKDVLSGFFFMAGLCLYASARGDRLTASQRWGVLGALLLGLLAKPMLVTLPFVLLLLDVWPLRRPLSPARVTEKWPLFAAVAFFAALTVLTQEAHGALAYGRTIPFGDRAATALESWVWYVRTTAWPTGLAVFYPYAPPPLSRALVCATALAGATALAVSQVARRPWWTVGWLWYLGMLVPVIGLVQAGNQARADRFMYLPLVGLLIPLVWACPARVLGVGTVLVVTALAPVARRQIGYWRDTITLFERAVAVTRDNYVAHARLGEEYRGVDRLDLAERHYAEAIRIQPDWGGGYRLLASLRAAQGNAAEAEALYVRATALDPRDVQSWGDLGMLRLRRSAWDDARAALERATALDPDSAVLAGALGVAAARAGDQATALAALEQAHRLAPDDDRTTGNLAWLLATSTNDAVRNPARALALIEPLSNAHPDVVEWLDAHAAARAALGQFDDAIRITLDAHARAAARGDAATMAQLEGRLAHYRAGTPYRDSLDATAPSP
jgi:protein O-mannosyl-transferase